MRVHRNGVAKAAAEQDAHREICNLAGQVPQGDVDTAYGWDMSDVVVHQRAHLLKVNLDGKGVLADQQGLHGFDTCAGDGPRGACLSVAGEPAVSVDPDQTIACDMVQTHGLDAGNLHLAGKRLSEEIQVG